MSQNGHVVASSANENLVSQAGRSKQTSSAPAIVTPARPRNLPPLTRLTRSPTTCVEMTPQPSSTPKSRFEPATEAAGSVALSSKSRPPTDLPAADDCAWADLFKARTLSRGVPGQANVVPARTARQTPNRKNHPTAIHGPGVRRPALWRKNASSHYKRGAKFGLCAARFRRVWPIPLQTSRNPRK